ncbi:bifunctional metallophosphatase/5'-nucleotidase [Thermoflavimicrobium dichotomicum]|uniref:5'-nucleotidase n=1 Tax=Thermoflavimicrobium dichotomicum TaxID=46223 RepID=A0A1I3UAG8_9BACL|nr:5'-nucleotidase C-terminal domain-containing protein [Thermoflavimicrobium dichotomicum]SFJ79912.1 5'-nucleotidase [Thermoflavimicrobium dichotomicum]
MKRNFRTKVSALGVSALTLLTASLVNPFHSAEAKGVEEKFHRQVDVQILSVNDFHGQLDKEQKVDGKPAGTAAYLASYLKQREKQNPNTLLVHAGDAVGASPPTSALLQDEPTIKVLNQMGFDVGTVGNHEFDEGVKEMKRLIYGGYHPKTGYFTGARFPYTVANVVDKKTRKPILPPSVIKQVKGIPIAFVGAVTTETPKIVIPSGVKDVEFIDEAEAINREVQKLKKKGVQAIMVLLHEGGFQDTNTGNITGRVADITKKLDPEVDVVFSGHTHTFLNGTVDGKLVVQGLSYGKAFADVDLVLDRKTKDVVSKKSEIVFTKHEGMTPDPVVDRMVKRFQEQVAPIVNQVVGKTSAPITKQANEAGESAAGNLIADAQRWKMKTDFAFMNPGGIRADIPQGDVTYGDLYTVQPFGNDLVSMKLTGAQIKKLLNQIFTDPNYPRFLQVSGLTYTWDKNRPANDRIVEVKKADGTPLDLSQTYTVTANYFLADGGDSFTVFKEGTDRVTGPSDLDALIEYIKQLPQPFSAQIEGRIKQAGN